MVQEFRKHYVIPHSQQLVTITSQDRLFVVQRTLLFGVRSDVFFYLCLREILGVEPASRRCRLLAYKRPQLINQIVAAAVDLHESQNFLVQWIGAFFQSRIKLQAFRIALPPVNLFNVIRGVHELLH